MRTLVLVLLVLGVSSVSRMECAIAQGAEWTIPIGGNAYLTAPTPGSAGLRRDGTLQWDDPKSVYSIYFRVDRPAKFDLALRASLPRGHSVLTVDCLGESRQVDLESAEPVVCKVGAFEVNQAGYVRVAVRGTDRTAEAFAILHNITVLSETEDLQVEFVRDNEGNMFYWGRRGPSVHLRYEVPTDKPIQFAYSEVMVPDDLDTQGSFFMANGFGEGYFGFQVNSPTERRVLFSVWSPFQTDNPRDIPQEDRIEVLAKGEQVQIGEFGNEGSGGQSYWKFPWKARTTYRFLTEVKPDDAGSTVYTAWFGEKSSQTWRLIASFRRPKTSTHLKGFHAFLENFAPTFGYLERRGNYGNVWVRDVAGTWYECTRAQFSVDPTGQGRHRLDYAGGAEGDHFYLRNCGFFSDTTKPGVKVTRTAVGAGPPEFDPNELPRG